MISAGADVCDSKDGHVGSTGERMRRARMRGRAFLTNDNGEVIVRTRYSHR